jgi:c-di-GMP-binding flagellar brake protein YcgR
MLVDRRRADRDRRHNHRVAVVFAVKNQLGARLQLAQAEDIGPGGMTIKRPKGSPCPPETPVSLSFELPGMQAEIAVSGIVVQDAGAGQFRRTGVRFLGLAPEQERLISAYCDTLTGS